MLTPAKYTVAFDAEGMLVTSWWDEVSKEAGLTEARRMESFTEEVELDVYAAVGLADLEDRQMLTDLEEIGLVEVIYSDTRGCARDEDGNSKPIVWRKK